MIAQRDWFRKVLEAMAASHIRYVNAVPPPKRVSAPLGFNYRYVEQTYEQAIIQKLARIVTGLQSAHLLLDTGFLQEGATIQRGVDEASEDSDFLCFAKILGNPTANHEAFLRKFWSEETDKTNTVRRTTIRDYIATTLSELISHPVDSVRQPAVSVYTMYSGYAHARSPQVMEMFDGAPPSWRLGGNPNSRFQRDHLFDIRNQYIRGTYSFAFAAQVFDEPDLFQQLVGLANEFSQATDEPA
ncbi:MAG: hypothetical protein ABL894_08050 [Hyphomicrobium sp.]